MSDLKCTKCGSDHVQNVQLVYESGTSRYRSRGRGIGVGISLDGIGVGVGGGRSHGVNRTELARRLSPPLKKRIRSNVFIFILLFFFETIPHSAGVISVLVLLDIVWAIYKLVWNRNTWPSVHEEWRKNFFCHRCGNVWRPDSIEMETNINEG